MPVVRINARLNVGTPDGIGAGVSSENQVCLDAGCVLPAVPMLNTKPGILDLSFPIRDMLGVTRSLAIGIPSERELDRAPTVLGISGTTSDAEKLLIP